MASTFKPELWHDLFVMIGTAAGSLVGLLFIVMSLHLNKISEREDVNVRATVEGARANTIHLLTVLIEAAVVLTPQPLSFMGAELIAINLFGMQLPLAFAYRYFNKSITISHSGGFPYAVILTGVGIYVVGIIAGVAAFEFLIWSLYLVALSCLIKIVRSVLTAWMLMFGMLQVRPSEPGS